MPSDFAGLLLLSPWVTFEQSSSSFQSNEHKDLLPRGTLKTWSDYFIGNSPIDNYSAALNAPASWWETMPFQKIAVVAGDDEVFRDDVVQMAKTFEVSRKSLRRGWQIGYGKLTIYGDRLFVPRPKSWLRRTSHTTRPLSIKSSRQLQVRVQILRPNSCWIVARSRRVGRALEWESHATRQYHK